MKKGFIFFIFILLSVFFINIGFGNWIFNTSINVKQEVGITSVGGIIECYKYDGKNDESNPYSKFATLEGAIASANSFAENGQKVHIYVTPQSFIDVKNQNLTLNNGVSLYLPYEGKTYDISSDNEVSGLTGSFVDTSEANIKKYNVSKLNFINTKLSISSGAELYIGGKVGEKGVCGTYAEIDLDRNSNIIVKDKGSMHCFGYIKENKNNCLFVDNDEYLNSNSFNNSFDRNRYIEIQNGGNFYSPITFYDAGGMGELTGLNSKKIFPINVFDFPNVQTYLKVLAGATFKAEARLSRTSGGRTFNVKEELTIVKPNGSTGNSLLTLNNGFISFEYCPLNPGFTSSDSSKTYIYVKGAASLGFLKIAVNGVEISTKDTFLPFSYKLQLIIGQNGNLETNNYKIKFMGGSLLKVLKGGSINVQSEIIGYKASSCQGIIDYSDKHGDSRFIINGTLKVSKNAKIGGHFKTEATDDSAIIDLTNAVQNNLISSSTEGLTQTIIKIYATGDFFDANTSKITSNLLKAGVVIKSDSNGNKCWADGDNLLSFVLSILVDNPNNYEHPLAGYIVYKYDKNGKKSQLSTEGVYTMSSGEYLFEKGESFEIDSLARAEKTEFTKQTGTNYTFSNKHKYTITSDMEITITAGEGVLVRFSMDNESGSGGSTVKISESITNNGTYYQIGQSSGGTAIEIAVKKNAYIKYEVKLGQCNSTILGDHYIFAGIVNVPSDGSTKQNGTKLKTTIKNKGWLASAISGGSTSASNNIMISGTSTIHAYIEKR